HVNSGVFSAAFIDTKFLKLLRVQRVMEIVIGEVENASFFFFFKQKTAYEIGLGIPAEPLFRSSCSVTMMLFLHLEVKPLMTLTTVLYLSCALISGHLAMMLMELTKRR